MNARTCGTFRDRLVELGDGTLPALEAAETRAHLAGCAECAAESDLLRGLAAGRRSAPAGFAEGVLSAWRAGGSRRAVGGSGHATPARSPARLSVFGSGAPIAGGSGAGGEAGSGAGVPAPGRVGALRLAATAAGVLLVGTLFARGGFGTDPDPTEVASTVAEAGVAILPWPGDDGVLAGAPALDALSNDEIEALLEELDS